MCYEWRASLYGLPNFCFWIRSITRGKARKVILVHDADLHTIIDDSEFCGDANSLEQNLDARLDYCCIEIF